MEKQDRYISREQEYKDVISDLQAKIREHSTRPLDIIEPKSDDQYLLQGIDIHDKDQKEKIDKLEELQKQN